MIETVVKNQEGIKELHNFAAKKEVNDAMSCSEKDLDEADSENPAENDVVERLSDFYSEKVVNDGESCLENDLKPSRAHDALPSVKPDSLTEDAKAEADEEEKVEIIYAHSKQTCNLSEHGRTYELYGVAHVFHAPKSTDHIETSYRPSQSTKQKEIRIVEKPLPDKYALCG